MPALETALGLLVKKWLLKGGLATVREIVVDIENYQTARVLEKGFREPTLEAFKEFIENGGDILEGISNFFGIT